MNKITFKGESKEFTKSFDFRI